MNKATKWALTMAVSATGYFGCGGGDNPPGTNAAGAGGSQAMAGGTSGGAGTGGTTQVGVGGTGGGAVAATPACAAGDDVSSDANADVISNYEDGYGSLVEGKGRTGGWYTYADMTMGAPIMPAVGISPVPAAPIAGGRCKSGAGETVSEFALHVTGGPFNEWGAGLGTDLAFKIPGPDAPPNSTGSKGPFNASSFAGVSFWARLGDASGVAPGVRLNVKDVQTDPEGKMCSTAMPNGPMACHDDFGKNIALTSGWKKYVVKFADMTQQGFGKKYMAIKADQLYSIQFQFPKGAKFDMWLDDLHFFK